MKKKTFFALLFICLSLALGTASAEIKEIEFENRHTISVATAGGDYDFYSTRTATNVDYNFPQLGKVIKFSPFFEYQSNLDINTWWRKELGAELGLSFFEDGFYYGASFQHVWQREENYSVESLDETTEWESRFVITPALPWGIFKQKVKVRLIDEYTYDFTRGQGTINQVAIIFDWQVHEKLRVPIGWRHVDRIHDFDSDLLEVSLVFVF